MEAVRKGPLGALVILGGTPTLLREEVKEQDEEK